MPEDKATTSGVRRLLASPHIARSLPSYTCLPLMVDLARIQHAFNDPNSFLSKRASAEKEGIIIDNEIATLVCTESKSIPAGWKPVFESK